MKKVNQFFPVPDIGEKDLDEKANQFFPIPNIAETNLDKKTKRQTVNISAENDLRTQAGNEEAIFGAQTETTRVPQLPENKNVKTIC